MGLYEPGNKRSVFCAIGAQQRTAHDALVPPLCMIRIDIKGNTLPTEAIASLQRSHLLIGQPVVAENVGIIRENIANERGTRIVAAIEVEVTGFP